MEILLESQEGNASGTAWVGRTTGGGEEKERVKVRGCEQGDRKCDRAV